MHNPFKPTDRMLRQFAGLWILFFGVIAAWQLFVHQRTLVSAIAATLAMTIGPLGLVWPRIIRPVFVGWMALAYPIGWTVSRIVLAILFFGMFTPLAFWFRLVKRDELGLKRSAEGASYWRPKPQITDKAQYLRQF
jgi:hypothetical protein